MDKISGTFELPPTDQALRPAKKPKDTGKLSSLLLSLFTAILDPSNTDVPHSLDLDVTSAQAQEYYATGKEELKQLLRVSLVLLCSCSQAILTLVLFFKDVPDLSNATEQATKTALDTSKIH